MNFYMHIATIVTFINSFLQFPFMSENVNDPQVLIGRYLNKNAEYASEKYNFKPVGTSIAFPDSVLKHTGVCFMSYRQIPHDQLIEILYDIASQLKKNLNSDLVLKNYMVKFPFTIENVSVELHFVDSNGNKVYEPEIAVAHLIDGSFIFKTNDTENENQYKKRIYEKCDPDKFK